MTTQKTYYIIAGTLLVDAVDENNYDAAKDYIETGDGALYEINDLSQLSQLLSDLEGWWEFKEITEEDYEKLI